MADADAISESRFGSFDSFNSLALTVNTVASSVSDSYGCPPSDSSFESPRSSNLPDLYLPGRLWSCVLPIVWRYRFVGSPKANKFET
jgi:hypothetical protein